MNNKEYKFRVWDSVKKELRYDITNLQISRLTGIETVILYDSDELYIKENSLMQYINRRDVNNMKIYEGDIVRGIIRRYDEDSLKIFPVIGVIVFDTENVSYGIKTESGVILAYHIDWSNIKIIGNVFNHPEILKGI